MGNCTGYCSGCKDDSEQDKQQVRNSYYEKDLVLA